MVPEKRQLSAPPRSADVRGSQAPRDPLGYTRPSSGAAELNANAMDAFSPLTRDWFSRTFAAPTKVQELGWARIARGEHVLLVAPTGSGKTLAAFLYCIRSIERPAPNRCRGRARALRVAAQGAGLRHRPQPARTARRFAPECAVERRALAGRARGRAHGRHERPRAARPGPLASRYPRDHPESLYLLLASAAREGLRTVETVIVDEVHALAPTNAGRTWRCLSSGWQRLPRAIRSASGFRPRLTPPVR